MYGLCMNNVMYCACVSYQYNQCVHHFNPVIESVSKCITVCVTYETSQCIERHYSNVCIYTLIFLYPLNNLQVSVLRRTLLISGILMVCLVYYFINFSAPIASQTLHISSNHSQPEKPEKPEKRRSGNGYMFAVGYSDQGTGSFRNLMSILCFAGKLGDIRIVEPFMVGSFLGINVSKNWREEMKFSDIFDTGVANDYAKRKNFSELVPFEQFLEDAPRKLLVVQHRCVPCHIPCGHPRALEKGRIFADEHGFEAVGQVCLDYNENGKTKLRDITKQIYNMYDRLN